MATTNDKGTFKVGIIIGSQRAVRICPEVAQFVLDVIKTHHTSAPGTFPKIDFTLLDIAVFDLPLTDELGMAAHITEPAGYTTARTRAWSAAVRPLDAFVFVTPQYNWGMPAALKNALDHLFNEWAGKPAMVVAYGGFGGTLSAAALITVLSGMFMRVIKKPVSMAYPDPSFIARSVQGVPLGLDATRIDGVWTDQKEAIVELWEEMLGLLVAGERRPSFRSPGLLEMWDETLSPMADIEAKRAIARSG